MKSYTITQKDSDVSQLIALIWISFKLTWALKWAIGIRQYPSSAVKKIVLDLNDNSFYINGPILTKLHRIFTHETVYYNS